MMLPRALLFCLALAPCAGASTAANDAAARLDRI
jgi:hypothetical protein